MKGIKAISIGIKLLKERARGEAVCIACIFFYCLPTAHIAAVP